MFNPKNFPVLVKDLALVFGRRKARVLVKNLKLGRGRSLDNDELFFAFAWCFEGSHTGDFWASVNSRAHFRRCSRRDLSRRRSREKALKASFKK